MVRNGRVIVHGPREWSRRPGVPFRPEPVRLPRRPVPRRPVTEAQTDMSIPHSHKLVLPADANHYGTLYAGAMLRLMLEAGYATAWKHVGPEANLVLRRVLNMECL